jgi:hypothetical protein
MKIISQHIGPSAYSNVQPTDFVMLSVDFSLAKLSARKRKLLTEQQTQESSVRVRVTSYYRLCTCSGELVGPLMWLDAQFILSDSFAALPSSAAASSSPSSSSLTFNPALGSSLSSQPLQSFAARLQSALFRHQRKQPLRFTTNLDSQVSEEQRTQFPALPHFHLCLGNFAHEYVFFVKMYKY